MTGPSDVGRYLDVIRHDFQVLELLTRAAQHSRPAVDVSDWQVTLIFYMACIYVKALGRMFGRDLQDHYTLRQWINTEPELVSLARPYRHVEEASRDARYEGRTFAREYIHSRIVPKFLLVRDHAEDLLEKRGGPRAPRVDPAPLFR